MSKMSFSNLYLFALCNLCVSIIAGFFSSSFYAIIKLKTHGFSSSSIYDITKATAVAKFLYASPSWWGLTLASKREHLEKVIKKS